MPTIAKPLGRKAYGSIGHLPNSRLGPGDHAVPEGIARICTERLRAKRYNADLLAGRRIALIPRDTVLSKMT